MYGFSAKSTQIQNAMSTRDHFNNSYKFSNTQQFKFYNLKTSSF